jgi:leucyl aminopeptidase
MLSIKNSGTASASSSQFCYVIDASKKSIQVEELTKYSKYLLGKMKEKKHQLLRFVEDDKHFVVALVHKDSKKSVSDSFEGLRKLGVQVTHKFNSEKAVTVVMSNVDNCLSEPEYLSLLEGMALGSYQFQKYKSKKKSHSFNSLLLLNGGPKTSLIKEMCNVAESNFFARNLINEPVISLNTAQLGKEISKLSKKDGFTAKLLNKEAIVKLKMGGLLGVNRGSSDPPLFAIMEWKPAKSKNKKPYVLVGKGVVYDTGGYSIKTGTYMATMKCDMSGAAAVIGTMSAVSKNKLPLHVIGLVPITDNRIGTNALVPDDVITMFDGSTVEVLNTDAEGRLILADALAYAKKYKPKLVIDLATLTGAAAAITGELGTAMMGTADDSVKAGLKNSGDLVYERLMELPIWDEYGDMIKSKVADIKNIGGPVGGAITAAKFLQHFTDYPWIHLDIAGPAFIANTDSYRHAGGTGVGVRLLYHYLKSKS